MADREGAMVLRQCKHTVKTAWHLTYKPHEPYSYLPPIFWGIEDGVFMPRRKHLDVIDLRKGHLSWS